MLVLAYILEVLGYAIKVILIIGFWLVVLTTTFNWLKISNRSSLVRMVRGLTEPILIFIRRKVPFLVQSRYNIDFTPILVVFIIILLHLILVDTLLNVALRLR